MKASLLKKVVLAAAVAVPLTLGAQVASANTIATSYIGITNFKLEVRVDGGAFRKAQLGLDFGAGTEPLTNSGVTTAKNDQEAASPLEDTLSATVALQPFGVDLDVLCLGSCAPATNNLFPFYGDGSAPELDLVPGDNFALSDMLIAGSAVDQLLPAGFEIAIGTILPTSAFSTGAAATFFGDLEGDEYITIAPGVIQFVEETGFGASDIVLTLPDAEATTLSEVALTSNGIASATISQAKLFGDLVALRALDDVRLSFDLVRFVNIELSADALNPGDPEPLSKIANLFELEVFNLSDSSLAAAMDLSVPGALSQTGVPGTSIFGPSGEFRTGTGLATPASFSFSLGGADTVVAAGESFNVSVIQETQADVQQDVAVPEPATLAMIAAGFLGGAGLRRRRRK